MSGTRDLTVDDVAERMQITPESVRRWLREKKLAGYQASRQAGWRVRPEDLERFIAERMNTAPQA